MNLNIQVVLNKTQLTIKLKKEHIMKKSIITMIITTLFTTHVMAQSHDNMQMDKNMDHSQMNHNQTNNTAMIEMNNMSAVGMPAINAKPDKVVRVILDDDMTITFEGKADIKSNDVVQFIVINTGKNDHQFSIGSHQEQLNYREMMKKMPNHNMSDPGNLINLKAGETKSLTWHFHGDNNVEFACNRPGHAEAGMVKNITL